MIETRGPKDVHRPATAAIQQREESRLLVPRSVVVISLLGMMVLLPIHFIVLPLNLSVVDVWNMLALPVCWLYLLRVRQTIRLPYLVPMWLIFLGSFTGALSAADPFASLAIVLKEAYLYVWFVTLVAVFPGLTAGNLRRLMLVWVGVALLHGGLLVAQFLSLDIFRITVAYAGRFGAVDPYRPSGLFENSNWAGFFQLTGFVPLVLVSLPGPLAFILAICLLLSIVATGSLGAIGGWLCGLFGALIAISILDGRLTNLIKICVRLTAATALLGGLAYFVIRQSPDFQARLEYTFYGRAEHSADSRFGIWQAGVDVLTSDMPVWGLGPGNFRDEGSGKTLHNDLLAFSVERGVIGTLGLVLLGIGAMRSAIRLLLLHKKRLNLARPLVVVFLAALIGTLIESLTHQIFHARALWLILALQEAALLKPVLFGSAEASAGRLSGWQPAAQPELTRG